MTDQLRVVSRRDHPDTRIQRLEDAMAPHGLSHGARGLFVAFLGMLDGLAHDARLAIPRDWLVDYFAGTDDVRLHRQFLELIQARLIRPEGDSIYALHPDRADLVPRHRRGRI